MGPADPADEGRSAGVACFDNVILAEPDHDVVGLCRGRKPLRRRSVRQDGWATNLQRCSAAVLATGSLAGRRINSFGYVGLCWPLLRGDFVPTAAEGENARGSRRQQCERRSSGFGRAGVARVDRANASVVRVVNDLHLVGITRRRCGRRQQLSASQVAARVFPRLSFQPA